MILIKHWDILSIYKNLKKLLEKEPFFAYSRNKKLNQIIEGIYIWKSKVCCKINENHKQSGKCSPCISQLNNLCCKKVKQTNILKRYNSGL